jgi:hypothetical protein
MERASIHGTGEGWMRLRFRESLENDHMACQEHRAPDLHTNAGGTIVAVFEDTCGNLIQIYQES